MSSLTCESLSCHSRLEYSSIFQGVSLRFDVEDVYQAKQWLESYRILNIYSLAMIFLFKKWIKSQAGIWFVPKEADIPLVAEVMISDTTNMTPCVVKLRQISDNITTTSEYKTALCWRFLSPLQDIENGYGIRVSGATMSQHWGNTFSSWSTLCTLAVLHSVYIDKT